MKLNWVELPDGTSMALGKDGTYFLHYDPTVEDGKPWVVTFEPNAVVPKEET